MKPRGEALVIALLAVTVLVLAVVAARLAIQPTTSAEPSAPVGDAARASVGGGEAERIARRLPKTLAQLPLARVMLGQEAAAEISQLHEGRSGDLDAFIAEWRGDRSGKSRHVKVWVSVSPSVSDGERLMARMTEGIRIVAAQGQMYTAPQTVRVGKLDIVKTRDTHLNTENYYWLDGKNVVWLETEAEDPAWSSAALNAWLDLRL